MAYHPFRRLKLKAFSLVLASVLWFAVSGDRVADRTVRAPLEYENIPAGLELVGVPPVNVEVRLRGESRELAEVADGTIVLVLDLSSARPGTRLFHLLPEDVRVPFGIDVTSVTPATVPLEFDRHGRRTVSVRPALAGEPAAGFVVSGVRVSPPLVDVEGPESRLARVDAVTTDTLSIDGIRANLLEDVTIGVVDGSIRVPQPHRATVAVEVVEVQAERVLRGVPVTVRRTAASTTDVSLEVDAVTVTVQGTREAVSALQPAALRVFVDLASRAPGRHVVPVESEGGPGYGIVGVEPKSIAVRIK
ncbi:MAG: CdaR family protein [Vicinamibacterales bacterium]